MKYSLLAAFTLSATVLGTLSGQAQTTTNATATPAAPPAAATPAPAPSGATMSTIVVTANTEGSVLPTDTPVASVFGSDMSVQDTPRTVTTLSPEILKAYDVQSLRDLSHTTADAYQTDQFGGYSVPNIRGQEAEVFINGMQRITRSDGPPTSFNSIESVDVVNGPASSVYGPTQYTGGYVNFVTKQPYYDKFHSTSSFTYGSYDTKRWSEDIGAPIIPGELAFRASYEGEDSGSYYNNVETKSQDGFFALAYTPNKDFRVDFNTEFEVVRFNENTGWNRPTQALISNHEYTGGTYAIGPNFVSGTVGDPTSVRISDSATNISPADSDYSKDYNAQLTMTYNANENLTFINRTYYEYEYLRNTELAQYYANLITSNQVTDRFEAHINFDTPIGDATTSKSDPKDGKDMKSISAGDPLTFKHEIITGFAFKYINITSYQGFFNEQLNATDLSSGTYPDVGNGVGAFDGVPIPGTNLTGSPGGNYGTGLNQPGTLNENAYEASAFFQHNITFTPQWSLLYGIRGDLIIDDLQDPLPLPGSPAVSDDTVQALGSGNVSIDYKPATWLTNYATFSFNQSAMGNTGGGYSTFSAGNNLSAKAYHLPNYLYELGSKADLFDHTFFTGASVFYQTHAAVTALGGISEIRTVGAELQQTYQPDKHFYMAFNESYLNATIVDPTAQFTELSSDIVSTTPNGGTPNFVAPGKGHYRESGLPQMLFNGIASYKLDCGAGASLSYVITDPIPISEVNPAWIPWQYQIDASIFYVQPRWEARLNLFNITDQHNFSSGGFIAGSGNDLITISEPFHMEGTVTLKF